MTRFWSPASDQLGRIPGITIVKSEPKRARNTTTSCGLAISPVMPTASQDRQAAVLRPPQKCESQPPPEPRRSNSSKLLRRESTPLKCRVQQRQPHTSLVRRKDGSSAYRLRARPQQLPHRGAARRCLRAAAQVAQAAGYEPIILGDTIEGEAREVASEHAQLARDIAAQGRRAAILSGGELTVTLRGEGRGGPN